MLSEGGYCTCGYQVVSRKKGVSCWKGERDLHWQRRYFLGSLMEFVAKRLETGERWKETFLTSTSSSSSSSSSSHCRHIEGMNLGNEMLWKSVHSHLGHLLSSVSMQIGRICSQDDLQKNNLSTCFDPYRNWIILAETTQSTKPHHT